MRLDKYLKVSRLIKRRTVANEACDQISLRFGQRIVTVEVLDVQETVRQADAGTLYREIGR